MAKKPMTIENLASLMQKEFKASNKRTDDKIDQLAIIVNDGFNATQTFNNQKFDKL